MLVDVSAGNLFASGMAYVVLSRVRSLQHIMFTRLHVKDKCFQPTAKAAEAYEAANKFSLNRAAHDVVQHAAAAAAALPAAPPAEAATEAPAPPRHATTLPMRPLPSRVDPVRPIPTTTNFVAVPVTPFTPKQEHARRTRAPQPAIERALWLRNASVDEGERLSRHLSEHPVARALQSTAQSVTIHVHNDLDGSALARTAKRIAWALEQSELRVPFLLGHNLPGGQTFAHQLKQRFYWTQLALFARLQYASRCIEVARDGSCFFHAVRHWLAARPASELSRCPNPTLTLTTRDLSDLSRATLLSLPLPPTFHRNIIFPHNLTHHADHPSHHFRLLCIGALFHLVDQRVLRPSLLVDAGSDDDDKLALVLRQRDELDALVHTAPDAAETQALLAKYRAEFFATYSDYSHFVCHQLLLSSAWLTGFPIQTLSGGSVARAPSPSCPIPGPFEFPTGFSHLDFSAAAGITVGLLCDRHYVIVEPVPGRGSLSAAVRTALTTHMNTLVFGKPDQLFVLLSIIKYYCLLLKYHCPLLYIYLLLFFFIHLFIPHDAKKPSFF